MKTASGDQIAGDVNFSIRADTSRLESDLNTAEERVYKSAKKAEAAADSVGESAQKAAETAAEAVENVAQSAQNTAESLNDVAEAAADTADNIGNAAQQAEQSFSDIAEAAEQTGVSAASAADEVENSAQVTAEALDCIAEAAQRAEECAADAGEGLGRSTEEAAKNYMTLGEELDAVNKLLEKDGKNTALCAQKKELLKKAIAETGEKLRFLKERQADVNQAYRNGDIPDEEYREFQREIAATEQELQGYRNELNNVGKASEEAGEKTQSKLSAAFGAVGKAAAAATAAVAAGTAAIGTAAVNSADSLDKAVKRVTAATGAGEDAAKNYSEVIKGVYSDNFGESFDDIAGSISAITQNLGEMDPEPLKEITESAYALQDVFDMGVDESARAAKAMSENFGIAAEDAYDYIAKGAQDGLNYSGELIDSISEYSVQFAKLGLSADDMFNIFTQGAENGAWNLDKIGDAVKELSIRVIDGSESTKAGFEALGYDADDMAAKFAQGGDVARDAFKAVITALAEMDDPIEQNTAGINLMGTMWEDLGADAVKSLADITDSAYDCAGAMDSIKEVNYSSLSDALGGLQRQAETLILPLGDTLIPIVEDIIGELSAIADEVIPQLTAAVEPVISGLKPIVTEVFRLISGTLPQIMELITPIIDMISGLVQTILPPLTDFLKGSLIPTIIEIVKWVEDKLFPIVQKVIEKLLPPLLKIIESLLPVVVEILDVLDPVLDLVLSLIDPIADILELITPIINALLELLNAVLKPLKESLSEQAKILEVVLGGALSLVADILSNTLIPAFESVIKFLSGDFMGGIESWGKAFEGSISNVCSIIDGIFGTHLSEWYAQFRQFFRDTGADLYRMTHADEINETELLNKYGGLGNDVIRRSNELMRSGMTAEEALSQAMGELIDTAEKSYYWDEHFKDKITVEETEARRREMEQNGSLRADYYYDSTFEVKNNSAGAWRNAEYAAAAGYDTSGKKLDTADKAATAAGNTDSSTGGTEYTYKPYVADYTGNADAKSKSNSSSSGNTGSKGNFISITSYVPTMWDNDQTAALKSLIGKEVLGKTAAAHQINDLTGVISGGSTAVSTETNLADVINAITRLQRKVENIEDAFGNVTIELTAGDLTIGKAAVRDCNIMAKRSGKSPFNF